LFAGFRFVVCGAVLTACSVFSGKQVDRDIKGSIIPIVMTGIFAVILHYAFTYLGLAMSESSKTAILKQLGALFYICFCFVFVKGETFSFAKIAGALLGFGGIIAINAGNDGFGFGLGDVFIILASVCTVVSNIYAKRAMQSNSSVTVTGISQLMGGVVLLAAAFLTGAELPEITAMAIPVFAYICMASTVAYCLWYYIVRSGDLSNLFIIKFSEPVFACVFGAAILNENIFRLQYLFAFVLISAGIVIANRN
jgi:drug/metabolite transporter (DMT)-like permease